MNEVDKLIGLGCKETTIEYMGDGVYCGFDGFNLWLCCRRENGFHYVALESYTMRNIIQHARKVTKND